MRRAACAVLLGAAYAPRDAAAQATNAANSPLLAPLGARLTALGGAGVGDTSAVNALFSSPAAYAHASRKAIQFEYAQDDLTKRAVATVVYPVRLVGTFALNGYGQDLGRQPRTLETGVEIATVYYRNVEIAAAYAAGFGRGVSAGVTFKYIQSRADCTGNCGPIAGLPLVAPTVSSTSAVDVGVQYDLPNKSPLHLGLALRNLGLKLQIVDAEQADALPAQLAAGVAYDVPHVDRQIPGASLRLVIDGLAGIGSATQDNSVRLGAEAGYQHTLFLRGGYAVRDGLYGGATVGFGVVRNRFGLDVARQLSVSSVQANNPPTYVGLRYAF